MDKSPSADDAVIDDKVGLNLEVLGRHDDDNADEILRSTIVDGLFTLNLLSKKFHEDGLRHGE